MATMPDLTDMERLLAHTLLAYCLYLELSLSAEAVLILHANIRSLASDRALFILGQPEGTPLTGRLPCCARPPKRAATPGYGLIRF
jgi:hypothetical protein